MVYYFKFKDVILKHLSFLIFTLNINKADVILIIKFKDIIL